LISSIAISTASFPDLQRGWKKEVGKPKTMGFAAADTIDGKERTTIASKIRTILLFMISPPENNFLKLGWAPTLVNPTSFLEELVQLFYQFEQGMSII
jgi:hypothetical protein